MTFRPLQPMQTTTPQSGSFRALGLSPTQQPEKLSIGLDLQSAKEHRALFPAKTGESPLMAGLKSAGNVPTSLGSLAWNIGGALTSPIQTSKGVFQTVKGLGSAMGRKGLKMAGVEELPKKREAELTFDAVAKSLKNRFGSLEALQRTATNDPVGFGADIVAIISGGAGLVGKSRVLSKMQLFPKTKRIAVAEKLKKGATKSITEALAPTKEYTKTLTAKIAPELAERKIIAFSKKGLSEKISKELATAGQAVDDTLAKLNPKTQVKIKPILNSLENTKNQFFVKGTKIVAEPQAMKASNDLQKIVAQLGDKASLESLRSLRQIWDKAVAKTNGFQKQLSDIDKLDIKKHATNAIRSELAKEFPELAKVNAEFTLWKNADKVIFETLRRTTGQKVGAFARTAQTAGGAIGYIKAGWLGLIAGSEIAKKLVQVFTSTAWKTTSSATKMKLADAIVSGNEVGINKIITGILATQIIEKTNQ